jgi:hypothetical protein
MSFQTLSFAVIAALSSAAVHAAGLDPAVAEKLGPPAEGKAQVVFFRPAKFTGAAMGYIVREGTAELGKLRNGKYFVADVEPGAHTYTVHSEAKDNLNLEVEAGETYFVSSSISMGLMVGHPNLSPSTAEDFQKVMAKLEKAKPLEK